MARKLKIEFPDFGIFTKAGAGFFLAGVRFAMEVLELKCEELVRIAGLGTAKEAPKKRTGGHSYWSKLTPEQRTAEMKRRYAKGAGKLAPEPEPAQKKHPGTSNWWASLSPAQKKAHRLKIATASKKGVAAKKKAAAQQLLNGHAKPKEVRAAA